MAQYMWHHPTTSTASSWISPAYPQDPGSLGVPYELTGNVKQKPSRVVKPSSVGNSPRRSCRRTMVLQNQLPSQAPTRNGQLEDSLYHALLAAASEQRARPISWHPSSAQAPNVVSQGAAHASWQVPAYGIVPMQTVNNTSGDANGLLAPLPYPIPPDEMSSSPLEGHQAYPAAASPARAQPMENLNQNNVWMADTIDPYYYPFQPEQLPFNPSPCSRQSPQSSTMTHGMLQRGDTAYYSSRSSAASLTPDILPIQKFDDEPPTPPSLPQKPDTLGDELVGMGLYDGPESPSYDPEDAFIMKADGTVVPVSKPGGKGLKLEETFVPCNEGSDGSSSESGRDEKDGSNFEPKNINEQQPHQIDGNDQAGSHEVNERWCDNVNNGGRSMPMTAGSFYFDNVEGNVDSSYLKPAMFPANLYANNNMPNHDYGWM